MTTIKLKGEKQLLTEGPTKSGRTRVVDIDEQTPAIHFHSLRHNHALWLLKADIYPRSSRSVSATRPSGLDGPRELVQIG